MPRRDAAHAPCLTTAASPTQRSRHYTAGRVYALPTCRATDARCLRAAAFCGGSRSPGVDSKRSASSLRSVKSDRAGQLVGVWLALRAYVRRRTAGACAAIGVRLVMSSFQWRSSARSFGLATLIGLGLVGSAAARPHIEQEYRFTERQLAKAKERVALLEARLEALAQERARLEPSPPAAAPNCDQPFVFDSSGIKLWRNECSHEQTVATPEPAPTCAMPFRVDREGIKHVELECIR